MSTQMLTSHNIETMGSESFTEAVVDLAIEGGPAIIAGFRQFLAIVGPCAKNVGSRWHALAVLAHLYAKCDQASPEIQNLQSLFAQRLIDEELKLHSR